MNRLFERPLFARMRRLCMALPETIETSSWDHPNFRAGGKTFCAFEIVRGRPSVALRVAPPDADLLLRKKNFFATPYGRGQWVSVWIDAPGAEAAAARLLERSYRLVANKRMLTALHARHAKGDDST